MGNRDERPMKPAIQSVTIWGVLAVLIAQAVKLIFGYELTPADQQMLVSAMQQVVEIASTVMTIGGGLLALWGRIRATKPIAGVVTLPPPAALP